MRLAALRMRPAREMEGNGSPAAWHGAVTNALRGLGYSTLRRGNEIEVWIGDERQKLPDGGYAVSGWRLGRLWLGPKTWAVGALSQRIYLRSDGSKDRRPERKIVDLSKKPQWPLEERRRTLVCLLDRLRDTCGDMFGGPVKVAGDHPDPQNGIRLVGSRADFPADENLRVVHKRGGLLAAPSHMRIVLCTDDGVPPRVGEEYRHRAEEAFDKRGVDMSLGSTTLETLGARLDELDQGGSVKHDVMPVLFMLSDNQAPPSHRLRQIMRDMERHRLPWRRAYATDDRRWSISDQVGSLLQAAGGHPHAVVLAGGECLPWSIGIDIHHAAGSDAGRYRGRSKREVPSRVAACLINPEGRLAGSWIHDQRRQENIEPHVLRRLLGDAADAIPAGDLSSGVLVIRDGRVFESENVEDYRRDLGGPVTLVELRKRRNPPLLLGGSGRLPDSPVLAWMPETKVGSLGFLAPLHDPNRNEFDRVLKIWMRRRWDGMGIGPQHLGHILFAQTLTPGLGLHRRTLPAPVYWADGIAGASENDLRFRGQIVLDLN